MTTDTLNGIMLLITRRSDAGFGVSIVSPAAFIPCVGARDETVADALSAAMQSGSLLAVKSLRRSASPDETACLVGKDWWFSTSVPD